MTLFIEKFSKFSVNKRFFFAIFECFQGYIDGYVGRDNNESNLIISDRNHFESNHMNLIKYSFEIEGIEIKLP